MHKCTHASPALACMQVRRHLQRRCAGNKMLLSSYFSFKRERIHRSYAAGVFAMNPPCEHQRTHDCEKCIIAMSDSLSVTWSYLVLAASHRGLTSSYDRLIQLPSNSYPMRWDAGCPPARELQETRPRMSEPSKPHHSGIRNEKPSASWKTRNPRKS